MSRCFADRLSFEETCVLPSSWIWRQQVPAELWKLSSNKLTNVTSQKTKVLTFTAITSSNLTKTMQNKKIQTYCLNIPISNYKVFSIKSEVYTAVKWSSELWHYVVWQMKTNTYIVKKEAGCSSECQNPENHKINVQLHIFILTFLTNYQVVVNSPHLKIAHSQTYRSHDITTVLPTSNPCTAVMLVYILSPPTNMCLQYIMPKRTKS